MGEFRRAGEKAAARAGIVLDCQLESMGRHRAEPAAEPVVGLRPGPPRSTQPGAVRQAALCEVMDFGCGISGTLSQPPALATSAESPEIRHPKSEILYL